nr:SURF1 family protein [Nocardioides luti]
MLAPRYWAVHLLALVLTATAVALGVWQYDAWHERRVAAAVDLTHLDPVPFTSLLGPDDPFPGTKIGQPVVLGGTWVPGGTLFVSGREQDGTSGYWVVTPLAITGPGDPAVPVVRGWVADPADAPAPPTGEGDFTGYLQAPQGTGEADPDPSDDVLPQLRIADVIQHVDQDLYGAYVVIADDLPAGDWPTGPTAVNDGTAGLAPATLDQLPDAGTFTALRNLLYAIEWWFFGAFALFVWVRWMRDELHPPVQETQATPAAPGEAEPAGTAADGQ